MKTKNSSNKMLPQLVLNPWTSDSKSSTLLSSTLLSDTLGSLHSHILLILTKSSKSKNDYEFKKTWPTKQIVSVHNRLQDR